MEQKTLGAESRDKLGKGESGRLRRRGRIPAVIYGHQEPLAVSVDAHEFDTKFHHISESTIIRLAVGGQEREVLIRDFQEDAVGGQITHIDFYEVDKTRVLRTHVRVELTGAPVGVKEGGLLEHFVHEVEVECLPASLPEKIVLDVNELRLGKSLHVRELPPVEGVRILNSPEQVVCAVVHKRLEVEKPVEAAAPAEGEEAAEGAAEGEEAPEAPAEE
jgi:large subunit ribosomal protein L25